jgi:hypothetical protein
VYQNIITTIRRNVSISNPTNDAYTINIMTRACPPKSVKQRLPGQERNQEWIAVTGALPYHRQNHCLDKDESRERFPKRVKNRHRQGT